MKTAIRSQLTNLIGLPLWGAGRVVDLEWFQFGEQRDIIDRQGHVKQVGSFALHVQCAWRLTTGRTIIVGSRDRFYPGDGSELDDPQFDWEKPGSTRCDVKLAGFFQAQSRPLVVQGCTVDLTGGFRLLLSRGHRLEIFPDDSRDGEFWRLFRPYTATPHFVVTGGGDHRETQA